jgi:6-phosphogluconolactonase
MLWAILASMALASCGAASPGAATLSPVVKKTAVYSMSNSGSGNAVMRFLIAADGTLQAAGSVQKGGTGTSAGIENQGALAVTEDGKFLLAVNPASDDFSVLRLTSSGPQLLSTTSSGGKRPISVSARRGLVYVLNFGDSAGDADNVTGFHLNTEGALRTASSPFSAANRRLSMNLALQSD